MKNEDFRASLRAARAGVAHAWREGHNVRFHWAAGYAAVLAGLWLDLPATAIVLLVLTAALVIVAEMLNTAVETAVDLAADSFHPLARAAKDLAAGAVLVASGAAVVVGAVVFGPHLGDLGAVLRARLAHPDARLLAALPLPVLVWGWLAAVLRRRSPSREERSA